MRKIVLCLLIASACALAGSVTNVDCPVVGGPFTFGCSADAGAYFATVFLYPGENHFGSASASFSDELVLTVTAGPGEGYVAACFTASGDTYMGTDSASANFLGSGYQSTMRAFSVSTCGEPGLTSYTLGVPITSFIELLAQASTSGATPQAQVSISFTGLEFFDASMNPASDVNYSLEEVPTPEPSSILLSLAGLLLCVRRAASSTSLTPVRNP